MKKTGRGIHVNPQSSASYAGEERGATALLGITLLHQIGPFPPPRLELIVRLTVIGLLLLLAALAAQMNALLIALLLVLLLITVTATSTAFLLVKNRKEI